jgi:hypothetical protein
MLFSVSQISNLPFNQTSQQRGGWLTKAVL